MVRWYNLCELVEVPTQIAEGKFQKEALTALFHELLLTSSRPHLVANSESMKLYYVCFSITNWR